MSRILAFGLCLAAAVPLRAQEVLVTPGARVRVTLQSAERVSGAFFARTRDSLLLEVQGPAGVQPRGISLADIQRVERYLGKGHPYGERIFVGIAVGGGIGALLGATTGLCERTGQGMFECFGQYEERGDAVRDGVLVGGITGALVGVIAGAIGHDRWQPASLPAVQPTITAGGSGLAFRLQVAVRF
jgi:hypothetical protein